MKTINLRNYYPSLYTSDYFVEVSDEIQKAIISYQRLEAAYIANKYYNKAQYSLDRGDGIEDAISHKEPSAEDAFDRESTTTQILTIMESLPKKQARRIYAVYFLGVDKSTLAKAEGITKRALNISIQCGLRQIKKIIKNFL